MGLASESKYAIFQSDNSGENKLVRTTAAKLSAKIAGCDDRLNRWDGNSKFENLKESMYIYICFACYQLKESMLKKKVCRKVRTCNLRTQWKG